MLARTSVFAFLFGALGMVASAQQYGLYRPYLEIRVGSATIESPGADKTFDKTYDWSVSDSRTHETDVTVFMTAEFALEWGLSTSSHQTVLVPRELPELRTNLGAFTVTSENFVFQVHYPTENRIKPYLGLGANRMRVSNKLHVRTPLLHYYDFIGSGNRWGLVAQLGVDFLMRWNLIINVDVKHVWNKAVMKQVDNYSGEITYHDLMVNPTFIGLGVGLRW